MTQSWNDRVLFRNRVLGHLCGMASLAQKIEAENRMRELLEESGLPQPDHVEYGYTCIRLFFHGTKQVVVIDIDEPDDAEGADDVQPGLEHTAAGDQASRGLASRIGMRSAALPIQAARPRKHSQARGAA